MNIVITPQIRKSDRHAKGYYVALSTNGAMSQPMHNFRKSYNGALRLITECVNTKAETLRKFGNNVHINPVKSFE